MNGNSDISLTYSTFKDLVTAKKLWWQYAEYTTYYYVFAIDEGVKYTVQVYKDTTGIIGIDEEQEAANKSDFETNYKDTANRPLNISAVNGESRFVGKKLEMASEDTSGYVEWGFDTEVFVRKAMAITVDAQFGDYAEFEILLKEDNTSLLKYGETIYLDGTGETVWFEGIGAGKIPTICKVRCTYYKAAGAIRKAIIIAEFLI